jgi:Zn finger protein HypA/HybF involved in hydrogenase expression
MHEISAAKEVIRILQDETDKPVVGATIEVGCLSGFKPDPIIFYFDMIKKNYRTLKACSLDAIEVKGRIICKSCKAKSIVSNQPVIFCPKCQSGDTKIIEGRDIVLKCVKLK